MSTDGWKSRDYAIEKLTTAVQCLALGEGDVRYRVAAACHVLVPLREADFPVELRKSWRWLQKESTKFGPLEVAGKNYKGSIDHTMHRVRKSTAAKLARTIWELYWSASKNVRYE